MTLENSKHIETRLIFVTVVTVLFAIHSVLFIDGNQRSCLGNPAVLPYIFFGIPSLMILAVLDIIYLAIVKKINKYKILMNVLIALAVFLSAFLFYVDFFVC